MVCDWDFPRFGGLELEQHSRRRYRDRPQSLHLESINAPAWRHHHPLLRFTCSEGLLGLCIQRRSPYITVLAHSPVLSRSSCFSCFILLFSAVRPVLAPRDDFSFPTRRQYPMSKLRGPVSHAPVEDGAPHPQPCRASAAYRRMG